ncbi:MAG: DeoR/GlpR family DNA-binding transcription regulator [Brevefilum sp.]|nr:DeoR/GlpR family DNA-binding transcription regulator [Brevefilum sp.]
MVTHKRRQFLLDMIQKQPCLRVSEMAEELDVSEGTIRNDLNALQGEGLVKRVHGGAVVIERSAIGNNSFFTRYDQNLDRKNAIAREAAKLVSDGDSILLDASSTAYCLACALADRKDLRVVTNGFNTANELAKNNSNNVALIGGMVNYSSSSVTGLLSERIIEDLHVQKAFLSCSGFSLERGMTEVHLNEAQLKRKVIHITDQLIALIDSSKFGKEDMTPFAKLENIDKLFTDGEISHEWKERLSMAGIDTVICHHEANATYD